MKARRVPRAYLATFRAPSGSMTEVFQATSSAGALAAAKRYRASFGASGRAFRISIRRLDK